MTNVQSAIQRFKHSLQWNSSGSFDIEIQSLLNRIKIKLKDAAKDVFEKVGVENMDLKIVYTIFIKDCISQYNLGTHHFKVSYLTLSNYCTY